MAEQCDVVVVGAGLAGLACSVHLTRAGLAVRLVEAADAVGGRVRTDVVDGFLLDRGFQVLSTGYPEARRMLHLGELDLKLFSRAALVQAEGRRVRLTDPRRQPVAAARMAGAPIGGVVDKLALAAYAGVAGAVPARTLKHRRDVSARRSWRRRGISDAAIDRVLAPFFAGVALDPAMDTSGRFVDLMMRMFVRGDSAVPAGGMQRLAEQLAARLPAGVVRLDSRVRAVHRRRVDTDGGVLDARAVVVATDSSAAHELLGGLPVPVWKGVTTVYHVADIAPLAEPCLVVDAERSPVNNTVVVSAAAPSYSPDGRALVATSLVHGAAAGPDDEPAVRRRLETLYRTSTAGWDHLATYDVPRALPAMTAPHTFQKPVRHGDAYVCGDHRDTSSIQGALVSGRRAATAVLADLDAGGSA